MKQIIEMEETYAIREKVVDLFDSERQMGISLKQVIRLQRLRCIATEEGPTMRNMLDQIWE